MKIPQDDRFRDERRAFALRFTCESCALWNEEHDRCANGFPTEEHRAHRYESPDTAVVFCKDFDLA